MSELLLLAYEGEATAEQVLGEPRTGAPVFDDGLRSLGVVRVAASGRFTVTTVHRPGSGAPFWGMLWEALFGLIFSVPASGSAYGPSLGGLFGAIDRAGIDEDVRAHIRRVLGPRTSAVAMLVREPDPVLVAELLGDGGTLVQASLSLEQDSELAEELGEITT